MKKWCENIKQQKDVNELVPVSVIMFEDFCELFNFEQMNRKKRDHCLVRQWTSQKYSQIKFWWMETVKILPFYLFFRAASKCTYICREDNAVKKKSFNNKNCTG